MAMTTKVCSRCRGAKPLDAFHRDASHNDGLSSTCGACANTYREAYYAANKDAQTAYHEAYRVANQDMLNAKARARYHANPDKAKAWHRANSNKNGGYNRKRLYGITEDVFQAMFARQRGCCAICEMRMSRPHVDHDHVTGAVRGLLCATCNTGLGMLRDSPALLRAATDYLALHEPVVTTDSNREH